MRVNALAGFYADALIAVAAISAFSLVGTNLSSTFSTIAGQL